jgi:type II secretory pathway component GspD/PulD (secretin)
MVIWVLCGALLWTCGAQAQGQSPTSPRPRPDVPDAEVQLDSTTATAEDGSETSSRFSGDGGRFGNNRKDKSKDTTGEKSSDPKAGEKEPAIRHTTSTEVSEVKPEGGGRVVVGRGKSGEAAAPQGLVTGAGSGTSASAPPTDAALPVTETGALQVFPVQSTAPVGTFEPILDREVEYGPLPEGGEVLLDLAGPKTVPEFMEDIRVATMWNILISESVREKTLEFWITEATPQQAMEILKFHDIYYEYDPESKYLYIMSVEEWQRKQFGKVEEHKFVLEHAENKTIEPLLNSMLSGAGRLVADARTRHIYVWDTPDNLALMEKAVKELDVPLEKRTYSVEFAEFADVQAAFTSMLSPAGSLLPDSRTNTFIAWDQPNVLERMDDALLSLDVPVQSKTFYLAHAQADDMLDYLEVMVSDRGVIQVDPRYNAIIVTDLPGRLEKITETLDVLDQELDTRTWVVDYADLEFLAEQIETKIPSEMGEIVVQEDVHQITVSGIPSRLDEIDKLITAWDVQRKQVQIEAFIVEVGSDVEREFNINWSYFGSNGQSPIFFDGGDGYNPEGGNLNIGQLPYTVPLYGALALDENGQIVRPIVTNTEGENVIDRVAGNNLAVTLEYLDKKNKATVLSSPRVAVQDGEEASFENKTEVPFVSATTFFSNNTVNNFGNTNNTNRVEFIDVGTILRVLPRITTKDNILLDISAEDSTFVEVRVLANDQESTVPQKTLRKAETQLRIQSGDTVVLGGLRRDRSGKTETRTPILGDLPGIGRLFRYPNKKSEKSSLLIFITPTIVDEFTDPQATILASAEESIAEEHRHNQKNLWGRIADTVSKNKNELTIAVGQSGDIHAEGERTSVEELRSLFEEAPEGVKVVLRHHPRAPEAVTTSITELARELKQEIEVDDEFVPLVPRYSEKPTPLEGSTP